MPRPAANVYRDQLSAGERGSMLKTLKTTDLKSEIALIRTRIGSLAAISDPKTGGTLEANRLLCRMMDTLARLVAVENHIGEQADEGGLIRDFNTRFLEEQRRRAQSG